MKSLGSAHSWLRTTRATWSFFAIAAAGLTVGCEDSLSPFEPEVTNVTDNFQLQATDVVNVTTVKTYVWEITGTQATVNHSTTTTHGTAQLIIKDADGTVVYDETLVPSLNETTSVGTTGSWTIELHLTDYSGTLNFRVQKTT